MRTFIGRPWRLHPMPRTAAWLLVLLLACGVQAQRPLNLDFEVGGIGEPDRPWGWTWGWSVFTGGAAARCFLDSMVVIQGQRSLGLEIPPEHAPAPPQTLMLQVPAGFALGRNLELELQVRVQGGNARAAVCLEAWGDQRVAAIDTLVVQGADEPGGWQAGRLRITVPADPAVHSIVIQVGLEGSGRAWFDGGDLRVEGSSIERLPPLFPPPTEAERQALGRECRPLARVDRVAGAPEEDLEGFLAAVHQARVIGLGESTHGTGEFFRLKHRLVELLVRRAGFRVFALEANMLTAARLDAWVQGGPGTVEQAMAGLFTVWHTREVRDLLLELRAWNGKHPADPVRVAGVDMQDHRSPADTLRALISRLDPGLARTVEERIGEYTAQPSHATWSIPDSLRTHWAEQAGLLCATLGEARPGWLAAARSAGDTLAAHWALQCATLVSQAAELNRTLYSPDRDSLMAANLLWALDTLFPGQRAVLWAHDMHVSRSGDPATAFNGGKQMGATLARALGPGYRAFSLLTGAGVYRATRSFTDHTLIGATAWPAPEGSLEQALATLPRRADSPGWFQDLRPVAAAGESHWLAGPRPVRSIGFAAMDYGFEIQALLPREFDGVFFLNETTASNPLP